MSDFWTAERVEWLIEGFKAGAGLSEMARSAGVTRNVIIGKVHRLQAAGILAGRAGNAVRAAVPRAPRINPQKPKPPASDAPVPEFDANLAQTVENAGPSHCRWPEGDPTEEAFRFCGRTKFEGSPYCEGHSAMVYQPKKPYTGRYHRR